MPCIQSKPIRIKSMIIGKINGTDLAAKSDMSLPTYLLNLGGIIMRLRIEIRTPKGYAASTSKKIQPFILGAKKIQKHQIYCNQDDNRIIWIVDAGVRDALQIQRNVYLFDKTTSMILKSKTVQGLAKLSKEDKKELNDMLEAQTKIRIIKHYDEMPDIRDWNKEV